MVQMCGMNLKLNLNILNAHIIILVHQGNNFVIYLPSCSEY